MSFYPPFFNVNPGGLRGHITDCAHRGLTADVGGVAGDPVRGVGDPLDLVKTNGKKSTLLNVPILYIYIYIHTYLYIYIYPNFCNMI